MAMKCYRFLTVGLLITFMSFGLRATTPSPSYTVTTGTLKLWLNNLSQSDNSVVSTWSDSSGFGNHCTQSNATYRPVFHLNSINGVPGVLFDGSNDYLTCGHGLDSTVIGTSGVQWTTFAVVYPLSNATQAIWDKSYIDCTGPCTDGGPNDVGGRGPALRLAKASDLDPAVFSGQALLPLVVSDKKDGSTSVAHVGNIDVANRPVIIVAQFNVDGATDTEKSKLFVNSVYQTQQCQHCGGSGASDNLDAASEFKVGAFLQGVNSPVVPFRPFNGYIFEILLYQGMLSASDRVTVQQYLNTKYAIPIGQQIYVAPDGKVGIGTTTPVHKFDVNIDPGSSPGTPVVFAGFGDLNGSNGLVYLQASGSMVGMRSRNGHDMGFFSDSNSLLMKLGNYSGDVTLPMAGSGILFRSPNGNVCKKLSIDNSGTPIWGNCP
jgi:hypothetical protein